MRIFTDFHHAGLLHSLVLLFEGRLKGEVYRPIGTEWFNQGFWKVYDHPATVEQFLGIGGNTPDGTPLLNEVEAVGTRIGEHNAKRVDIYNCHDIDSGLTNKAITFEGFMSMKFDIVIASIPQHVESFKRLCELHPDHPKLIFQIGNAWTIEAGLAPNIMASAIIHDVPKDINFISYHQEFDTSVFHPAIYSDPIGEGLAWNSYDYSLPKQNIYSFVNCFDTMSHFAEDWQLFRQVEQSMQDWHFKCYGGQCRDGAIGPASVVADKMRESRFIWHTKAGGDGYGHVIHSAFAVGRPLIVKRKYYEGKMAEALLTDDETCIVIDGLDYQQVINKVNHYSEPSIYANLCKSVQKRFEQVVDFDKEQKEIEVFLSKLV